MTVGYGSNLSDNFRQERHYVEPSSTLGTVVAGSTIAEKTTASVTISATSTESVTVSVTTTSTSVTGTKTESNESYTLSYLKITMKYTDDIIEQYFDKHGDSYSLKKNCGYRTLSALNNALYQEYNSMLILNNFMNGNVVNKTGKETSSALKTTSDGKILSIYNFMKYAEEIRKVSAEEAKSLKEEALQQLISQFSRGNFALGQVKTVLNAIGVTNIKQMSKGQNYEFSFEFGGKKYTITCNKEAAKSGIDDINSLTIINNGIPADDFDKEVTSDVALSTINEIVNMYKDYYVSVLNYSESFFDLIKNYIISDTYLPNNKNVNLKEIVEKVKIALTELAGDKFIIRSAYYPMWNTSHVSEMLFDQENNCSSKNITTHSKFLQYIIDSIFIDEVKNLYDDNGVIIGKYRHKQNYAYDAKSTIQKQILEVISQRIGIPLGQLSFYDIVNNLDSNNNSSGLDELYEIAKKVAFDYDIDSFMGESDSIDAEYFIENLSKLNIGLYGQELYKRIQSMFDKLDMSSSGKNDKIKIINNLFQLINNKLGIENTKPPTLSKEAMNLMYDNDIVLSLELVINDILSNDKYVFIINSTSQVSNEFYQGVEYNQVYMGNNVIKITNTETNQEYIIDINELVKYVDESYKASAIKTLMSLPAEVLIDMSVESTFYSGTLIHAYGTYNGGTQIRLNCYDSETMVHETGHAISSYLNANFAYSAEFKNAFNVGLQRYLADGHRQNIDIWSGDDDVNVSYGAYCTTNPMECFAECYTLLMLGTAEYSASALVKYFPECLELVKEFLKQVRNMDDSVRKS